MNCAKLQKVCSVLSKHNVDCILAGGTAVGYYGYRRISGITSMVTNFTFLALMICLEIKLPLEEEPIKMTLKNLTSNY